MSSTTQKFQFQESFLSGVYEVLGLLMSDSRGSFSRLFCNEHFREIGFNKPIVQINTSHTMIQGSIRGLHFQYPPSSETKIVTCLKGEVFDVAVDIRLNSPTFLQWFGLHLSAENNKSLLIPEGFAHGFQTITDNVDLLYFVSAAYNPESEGGLLYSDSKMDIKWPNKITEVSDKDRHWPMLDDSFRGIDLSIEK